MTDRLCGMKCESNKTGRVFVVVYKGCQMLDVSGPVEALHKANVAAGENLYDITLIAAQAGIIQTSDPVCLQIERDFESITAIDLKNMVAEERGYVASAQGPKSAVDSVFADNRQYDLLLIPGGSGTRTEVNNPVMLNWLQQQSVKAKYVTSVCTGSALLAKAGLLDGLRATSNKMAFAFAESQGSNVQWVKQARWVEDGKFLTSSGVSAGIDMSLALIENVMDDAAADQAAIWAEYERCKDVDWDPFAEIYNLV